MTARVTIVPKASQSLDEHFASIAQDNLNLAIQFFDSAPESFSQMLAGKFSLQKQVSPDLFEIFNKC